MILSIVFMEIFIIFSKFNFNNFEGSIYINLLNGFKQIISGQADGGQITNNISFLTGVKVK